MVQSSEVHFNSTRHAELAARAVRRFKADIYVGLASGEAEPVCRLGGAHDVVRWETLSTAK